MGYQSIGNPAFIIDRDVWTCPTCEVTRRVPLGIPVGQVDRVRRALQEEHHCKKFLPG